MNCFDFLIIFIALLPILEASATISPCTLPPFVEGVHGYICFAFIHSYSYDAKNNACLPFSYGGCGGNSNRFKDQQTCEEKCLTGSNMNLMQFSRYSEDLDDDSTMPKTCVPPTRISVRSYVVEPPPEPGPQSVTGIENYNNDKQDKDEEEENRIENQDENDKNEEQENVDEMIKENEHDNGDKPKKRRRKQKGKSKNTELEEKQDL